MASLPRAARMALAFAGGLLTFAATKGGLVIVLPWMESGLVAGIAIGLLSPIAAEAGLVGCAVALAGVLLPPTNAFRAYSFSLLPVGAWTTVGAVATCALVATGAAFAIKRRVEAERVLIGLALLLVVGNLWYSTLALDAAPTGNVAGTPLPSLNSQLASDIATVNAKADPAIFFHVYQGMKQGRSFYPEYSRVIRAQRGAPGSIFDYREPTIFWFWTLLPKAQDAVIAFLVVATIAILSLIPLHWGMSKLPLIIPAAAALAAFFMYFSIATRIFQLDPWAGALSVPALAALAVSVRTSRWRVWTCVAVAVAVLSVLVREVTTFLVLAGFVSAWVGERTQRRFRVAAWATGLLLYVGIFTVHFIVARPYIVAAGGIPRAGEGSFGFMLSGLTYASGFLGYAGWLPFALAAIGFVGCYALKDLRLRVFAATATVVPLVSFLFIGNTSHSMTPTGQVIVSNYWGTAIEPLLYALVPLGLAFLFGGMSRPAIRGTSRPGGRVGGNALARGDRNTARSFRAVRPQATIRRGTP